MILACLIRTCKIIMFLKILLFRIYIILYIFYNITLLDVLSSYIFSFLDQDSHILNRIFLAYGMNYGHIFYILYGLFFGYTCPSRLCLLSFSHITLLFSSPSPCLSLNLDRRWGYYNYIIPSHYNSSQI